MRADNVSVFLSVISWGPKFEWDICNSIELVAVIQMSCQNTAQPFIASLKYALTALNMRGILNYLKTN